MNQLEIRKCLTYKVITPPLAAYASNPTIKAGVSSSEFATKYVGKIGVVIKAVEGAILGTYTPEVKVIVPWRTVYDSS